MGRVIYLILLLSMQVLSVFGQTAQEYEQAGDNYAREYWYLDAVKKYDLAVFKYLEIGEREKADIVMGKKYNLIKQLQTNNVQKKVVLDSLYLGKNYVCINEGHFFRVVDKEGRTCFNWEVYFLFLREIEPDLIIAEGKLSKMNYLLDLNNKKSYLYVRGGVISFVDTTSSVGKYAFDIRDIALDTLLSDTFFLKLERRFTSHNKEKIFIILCDSQQARIPRQVRDKVKVINLCTNTMPFADENK